MTLLSTVQNAALRIGLTKPSIVIGATDQMTQELLEVAQEEGIQLMKRATWQVLRKQRQFAALAQEEQTGMVPTDYDRFINETFWNRTRKIPFYGPLTPQEWQQFLAWDSSPVTNTFTFRGGEILVTPNPSAGDDFVFEYISKDWCESSTRTPQAQWEADTDVGILPEPIMTLGIVWRYKQKKGLRWQPDYENWDGQVKQANTGDSPMRTVQFGNFPYARRFPGIVVPQGNWP